MNTIAHAAIRCHVLVYVHAIHTQLMRYEYVICTLNIRNDSVQYVRHTLFIHRNRNESCSAKNTVYPTVCEYSWMKVLYV